MKYVFVDWGHIMFTSIFCSLKDPAIPCTYRAMSMMIAYLKYVGLDPDDIVVVAVDSAVGSWRKEIDPAYKANRKARRLKYDINWEKEFKRFRQLLDNLESTTPFHIIEIDRLEADDIISYGCRKFNTSPCVIISSDSDFQQLCRFDNIKIFSPMSKRYKHVLNPYKVLDKKIIREKSDNLISKIVTPEDYTRRETIVSLIKLPEHIEASIEEKLKFLPNKEWNKDEFFHPALVKQLNRVYDKHQVVRFETKKPRKPKPVKQMYLF